MRRRTAGPKQAVVTRFAPSPTGQLHTGHAYAALVAASRAAAAGGRFHLRIEDIDAGRCRAEFVDAIFEDLAWLGLEWESEAVVYQSQRMAEYGQALDRLRELGALYPCFCTRKDIQEEVERSRSAPQEGDGMADAGPPYPGTCRRKSEEERNQLQSSGKPFALRLDLYKAMGLAEGQNHGRLTWRELPFSKEGGEADCAPEAQEPRQITCEPSALGDVVLARKDTPTSYHLAVTVDDHLQGVTLVTRGEDLAPSAHIQRLLQALLGYRTPDYLHHDLIRDHEGRRLSKRNDAQTLQAMRQAGITAANVRRILGFKPEF